MDSQNCQVFLEKYLPYWGRSLKEFLKRNPKYSNFQCIFATRWTFFRVKLVFEFEFEISWSLGPLNLRTLGPWDSWISSFFQHLLILPHTSSYLLLSLLPTLLLWYGLVKGGGVSCDIGEWDWRWNFDLYIDPLGPPPSFYILFL